MTGMESVLLFLLKMRSFDSTYDNQIAVVGANTAKSGWNFVYHQNYSFNSKINL